MRRMAMVARFGTGVLGRGLTVIAALCRRWVTGIFPRTGCIGLGKISREHSLLLYWRFLAFEEYHITYCARRDELKREDIMCVSPEKVEEDQFRFVPTHHSDTVTSHIRRIPSTWYLSGPNSAGSSGLVLSCLVKYLQVISEPKTSRHKYFITEPMSTYLLTRAFSAKSPGGFCRSACRKPFLLAYGILPIPRTTPQCSLAGASTWSQHFGLSGT
ncbi:hypothetical protein F4677DRAFT_285506 [Hypoxylon crocopeplum]|nr:hypothetical protein F4677DRAFT_285506 [Hypoxylon crocopeplum]